MNTCWLKIKSLAIVIVGLIFLMTSISGCKKEPVPDSEQEAKPRTYQEQVRQDDKRLRAEPVPKRSPRTTQAVRKTKPRPRFKELIPEDKVRAEKLFETALAERKMGRLPGVKLGYKNMVEHCREIIRKWPESEYAFKAKRMLRDIPQRYRKRYNITDEETDLGSFK